MGVGNSSVFLMYNDSLLGLNTEIVKESDTMFLSYVIGFHKEYIIFVKLIIRKEFFLKKG